MRQGAGLRRSLVGEHLIGRCHSTGGVPGEMAEALESKLIIIIKRPLQCMGVELTRPENRRHETKLLTELGRGHQPFTGTRDLII